MIQVYPESLLVYHVRTGKTTVVGCIKLTTIMAFIFACVIAAPAFYNDPSFPWWSPIAGRLLNFRKLKSQRMFC